MCLATVKLGIQALIQIQTSDSAESPVDPRRMGGVIPDSSLAPGHIPPATPLLHAGATQQLLHETLNERTTRQQELYSLEGRLAELRFARVRERAPLQAELFRREAAYAGCTGDRAELVRAGQLRQAAEQALDQA